MTAQFSRRCVIAAIDTMEASWYHKDFTAFLVELGPEIYNQIRSEPISLKNRASDLKRLFDLNPAMLVGGQPLASLLVERAVKLLPPERQHEWSRPVQLGAEMETFKRTLEMDGYTVAGGALRRILPADIGLPETESELMRLLGKYCLDTPKSHLQQAMDAHARGNWAGANGQIRTFFDALLDAIAERIDPSAQALPTGQPRRSKLASHGFLSVALNEWADDGKGYINGLVRRLHPAGPHPGLSDEDDSTFRLHTVLLTTTLLLRRFDRGPVAAEP
jgi:hypothetical protein